MSEEVAPAVRPFANFVSISGPLSGDIICGDKVVAGGTYLGVSKMTVTLDGVSKPAVLSNNGSWSATLENVSKGTWDLTATPLDGGVSAATESNITVENPCTLVVANPPVTKISLPYTVNGTADFTPRNGDISVSAELISPPPADGFPGLRIAVPMHTTPFLGTWDFPLPFVANGKGYSLEVRRNDGTGAMLSRVTIGPFEIG